MYISMVLVFSKIVMVDVTGMQVSEFGFWVESALKTRGRNKGQSVFCGGRRCEGCIRREDVGGIH
jgi:hypothetical protein